MTDPTPAPPPPAPAAAVAPAGRGPVGKVRNPWAVIGLTIITLGIYYLYWVYQVYREMKERSGLGIGPVVGLIFAIIPILSIINVFLIPSEAGNMYAQAGQPKPVSGLTGFWTFIPIIGGIIWIIKVQGALNRAWES